MPRYIDVDALKKDIRENYVIYGYADFISDFFRCLDEQPTVDAVEVVRCKGCKSASLTYDGECKYCQRWKEKYDGESVSLYLDGDFYCAFGERKEDAKIN